MLTNHGIHEIDLLLIGNFPPFSFIQFNLIAGTLIAQQKIEVNLTKNKIDEIGDRPHFCKKEDSDRSWTES
jgi:hypothetical protein